MVGLDVPVIPVEHQYIVTEAHPANRGERKKQGLPEMGRGWRESDSSWYMREEKWRAPLAPAPIRAWRARSAMWTGPFPDDSEYELFQGEDLERLMPHIETAITRVPAFGEVWHQ